MKTISALALGAALAMCAVPAIAQQGADGTGSPRVNKPSDITRGTSKDGPSTVRDNNQAPPAATSPNAGSGSRALTPGEQNSPMQNPDATPRSQSPGGARQLPGMEGQ